MKNIKLQNFLRLYLEANAIVLTNSKICDLISFNNAFSFEQYQQFLEEKNYNAANIHLQFLLKCSSNVKVYLKFIEKEISVVLKEFIEKDGFLIHRRLVIKDRQKNEIPFEELIPEVKGKISKFISLQKSSLLNFLSKVVIEEKQLPCLGLRWAASKTDLVELSNALYEGGFIRSENGPVTKKDFMQIFFGLFDEHIGSPQKILNKAILRENPAQFLDKLKSTQLRFCT